MLEQDVLQAYHAAYTLAKLAEKPLRERVEVYAVKDGKVLAGTYPDGSPGVPGGGIEDGETPQQAAKREYEEETGLKIKNIRKLSLPPLVEKWEDRDDLTEKEKERRKEYSGSVTRFFLADIAGKKEAPSDPTDLRRLVPRKVDSLLERLDDSDERDAARAGVLEKIKHLTS